MKAKIYINYKEGILDPEGLTVSKALNSIGVQGIDNLSIGKCVELDSYQHQASMGNATNNTFCHLLELDRVPQSGRSSRSIISMRCTRNLIH